MNDRLCCLSRGNVVEDYRHHDPRTPSMRRVGFDGSVMKRHDHSQRSDRLAVTFGDVGDVRVVDRRAAPMLACLAWGDGCR